MAVSRSRSAGRASGAAAADDPRRILRSLFNAAVSRAVPGRQMTTLLPEPPKGRTVVLGAGKAAGAMAQAVDAAWPADAPLSGLVVTRHGHIPDSYRAGSDAPAGRIEVVEAAHPVPDAHGLRAARRMAELAQTLGPEDLALCLISGGGSALLSLPAPGIDLSDKQAINRALLASGASIGEMNCVRKHLSAIKGGRLAALCAPARVVTILISDVPGDDPAVIASGPTVPDPSTCADALQVLERYRIATPTAVRDALRSGGLETPKPGDPAFADLDLRWLATPQQALQAAADAAAGMGLPAYILSDRIEGESQVVGQVHAALALQVVRHGQPFAAPCVILSGGETTVTLQRPGGRGGRALEFLGGAAHTLQGAPGIHVLAADTDGIDGTEDNAGGLLAPDTLMRAEAAGLRLADHLDRHDLYNYFKALDDLVMTGPTYTNVNDFRAILIQP